jgi:hypothetical protein
MGGRPEGANRERRPAALVRAASRSGRGLALAAIVAAGAAVASPALGGSSSNPPIWAVDPADAAIDAPPAGRSLFDFVATVERDGKRVYDIPFPFEALVKRLEERAGCAQREPCAKQVLVPLGRSLQRAVASPEFFKYPRVVAAIDVESRRGASALLKDRVYLGYQEKAELIEVISYNDAAGRFEFQLVKDYRPGATPRIVYAQRQVCAACHQNLAPIFSRQVWNETNANPRIAAALERVRSEFHGVPVRRGVDLPNAIDAATDRANTLGVWQLLWREGCGGNDAAGTSCRAGALLAALQYRLSGDRAFDERAAHWREVFLPVFAREWRTRWPGGLAVPGPDLPNRDPVAPEGAPEPTGLALSHVAAVFEPLVPRAPLEVLTIDRPETPHRLVRGLAEFIANADVRALDEHLAAQKRSALRRDEVQCEASWTARRLRFDCAGGDASASAARAAGRVELEARRVIGGELTALAVGGAEPLRYLEIESGTFDENAGRLRLALFNRGMRARLADGAAIASVELSWRPRDVRVVAGTREVAAKATVSATDDFAAVRDAVAALATDTAENAPFAARPFSRARILAAVFARLGVAKRDWCCDDAASLPPLAVEPEPPRRPPAEAAKHVAGFYPLCASCHATSERLPPNFLFGSGEQVAANVKHCAPRIYARLAMWRVPPAARAKTPMPPPSPKPIAHAYDAPAGAAGLEHTIAELLRAETGQAPQLEQLLAGGYEGLRPCLPEKQ